MSQAQETGSDVRKLCELIKGIKVGMLTTVSMDDGALRSRPMETLQVESNGDLWFFTSAATPKADEIDSDHRVNVSYADPGDNRYVSVSGTARLVRDREKEKELWNPALKAWFPKGVDDPDLTLLRVHVNEAEYWDSPSGTFVKLAGFVKALTTGERYDAGDHEKIKL